MEEYLEIEAKTKARMTKNKPGEQFDCNRQKLNMFSMK